MAIAPSHSTSNFNCATQVTLDIYPFPVVFGLHNGSAAWPYVIYWDWEILALEIDPSANNIVATGEWISGIPGMETPAPPPENGEVPDLTAVGPCTIPVGSIGILKDIPNNGGGCPILAQEPQSTQPCALPLNSTVATQVSARMLAHTECSGQTWPNVTGLTGKCRPKSSEENRLLSDATLFTSLMIFTSFGIFSLLLLYFPFMSLPFVCNDNRYILII
jgi:hypothetical protein